MSLTDYLAKNYLTADSKPDKKSKKRKRKEATSGLTIADDDQLGWKTAQNNDADDDGPTTIAERSAEFRKTKSSTWKTITGASACIDAGNGTGSGSGSGSGTGAGAVASAGPDDDAEQAAADAILSRAAAESRAPGGAGEDDGPVIESEVEEDEDPAIPRMESGAVAGLQSAAQLSAQLRKARKAEEKRLRKSGQLGDGDTAGESGGDRKSKDDTGQTIYRDATGRVVNIAMQRAEARRQAEAKAAAEKAEAEAAKGDVQRADAAKQREALAEAKFMHMSRYADDVEMNEELKAQSRWNDPSAAYLSTSGTAGASITGRPLYPGAAPPNRYGIRPGHKWDGVDRSNGFEAQWFKARNVQKRNKELDFAWQTDE